MRGNSNRASVWVIKKVSFQQEPALYIRNDVYNVCASNRFGDSRRTGCPQPDIKHFFNIAARARGTGWIQEISK